MTGGFIDELMADLPGQVDPGGSVGKLCTYRVGGSACAVVRVSSVADLERIRERLPADCPILVVGAGSNLLVSDAGFSGVVLQLDSAFGTVEVLDSPDGSARVVAGGAALLPRVARQMVAANLTGFEWAVGVPGTVGGAVRMNAGGHGSDMAACVSAVSVFNIRRGGPELWSGAECGFGYRTSSISTDDVVLFAELALEPAGERDGAAELQEIVAWRRAHQPGGQNAGSVFANPTGESAGRLIDTAGLKGLRIGTAHVSEKHANFIQSEPGGSADDVAELIAEVRARVMEVHGIELTVENLLVGFDS